MAGAVPSFDISGVDTNSAALLETCSIAESIAFAVADLSASLFTNQINQSIKYNVLGTNWGPTDKSSVQ